MTAHVTTARARTAASSRRRAGAHAFHQTPATYVSTRGRAGLEAALCRVLAGDCGFVDKVSALWMVHGWSLPPVARREGGIWLWDIETIASAHRAHENLDGCASPKYGEPWFERYWAPAPSHGDDAQGVGGVIGLLPRVDCTRAAGSPLPPRACELVRAGMCCILQNARLWPAAEAKWANPEYLRQELSSVRGGCTVLSSPVQSQRFSYWFDASSHSDRVQAGYRASPLVTTVNMDVGTFLDASAAPTSPRAAGKCLYLQQSILQAPADGTAQQRGLHPCVGLGEGMQRDVASGIDMVALQALVQAGGFGPWQRCQLFVGGAAAEGARSILHFDQYDNLFIQLAGTKRFRIYDPQQTGHLYAYPIHHPLDTRSQVDLAAPDASAFPRLCQAQGVQITLGPGEMLFLPAYCAPYLSPTGTPSALHASTGPSRCTKRAPALAQLAPPCCACRGLRAMDCARVHCARCSLFYKRASDATAGWHEVVTEPFGAKPRDAHKHLTVSVNFWFAATAQLLRPRLPLVPSMVCECARQLEYLISDCLHDRARHVPSFFEALLRALEAARHETGGAERDAARGTAVATALHAMRPSDIPSGEWQGLFEYVVWKLALLIGAEQMLPFVRDLCSPARFAQLQLA